MRESGRFQLGSAVFLPLAVAVLASGCAANSYMGIDLRSGAASPLLQSLADRARRGDKHAQLELGIRFEEGRDLPVDIARAKKLYRLAAADSGGTLWVYSPPVGSGTSGRVIPVNGGAPRYGLPNAARRLTRLEQHEGCSC